MNPNEQGLSIELIKRYADNVLIGVKLDAEKNRSYFGKIFHENMGKSPQDFLISYRMSKATEIC